MNAKDKTKLAQEIASIISNLPIRDAIDVIGEMENICAKVNPQYSLISIYIIAEMISAMNGEKAIISITEEGGVNFTIEAKDDNNGLDLKL